jgi:arylsulfatase A-like enzyme
MHGTSFVEALTNDGGAPNDWRDAVYYRYYESHGPHRVPKHDGVRTELWKLIWFPEVDPDGDGPRGVGCFELYDLQSDPDELTSLADDPAYAEIRKKLEARLALLRKQYA